MTIVTGGVSSDKRGNLQRWALAAAAALGVVSITVKMWRLVGDPGPQGAIDLKILYNFTRAWFADVPIYSRPENAGVTYPPATFLLLWPVFGWTTLREARVIWGVISVAALCGLAFVGWRATRGANHLVRLCLALAPFSMPPLVDALGIGQLTIVAMLLSAAAVLLAIQERPSWTRDAAAAILFDVALVKPSITIPFFVPLLTLSGRLRPAVLTAAGYGALTIISSLFQTAALREQIRGWLRQARGNSGIGYGDVQDWLFHLGWQDAFAPVSLSLLVALIAFCWWSRRGDPWVPLGVAAIVARLWTYHRVYDDAILLIALLATARIATSPDVRPALRTWAERIVIAAALVLWIPLQFHYVGSTIGPLVVSRAMSRVFNVTHTLVALLMLAVLTATARSSHDSH